MRTPGPNMNNKGKVAPIPLRQPPGEASDPTAHDENPILKHPSKNLVNFSFACFDVDNCPERQKLTN